MTRPSKLDYRKLESRGFDGRLIRQSPSRFSRRDIADGPVRTVFIVIQPFPSLPESGLRVHPACLA